MVADAKTRYYTTTKLGPRRELTPDGFLMCLDVPVARTGFQLYAAGETPVPPGPNGITKIWRKAEEVFRPETIASFNGKAVVNEHPSAGHVTPHTWRELAVGVVLNPRRGTGIDDDLLLADFIITDVEAIRLILEEGKDEVSCGYEADYVATDIGEGEQRDIIGNHVALVDAGRCGARCSIGDTAPAKTLREDLKAMAAKVTFISRLTAALAKPNVAKVLDEEMGAMPDTIMGDDLPAAPGKGDTHVHIHTGMGEKTEDEEEKPRMKWDDKALDAKFEELGKTQDNHQKAVMDSIGELSKKIGDATYTPAAKTGDEVTAEKEDKEDKDDGDLEEEEPKKGTGDSAKLVALYQETVAMAEVVAPGVKLFTMDSTAPAATTVTNICQLRRRALDAGLKDPETNKIIKQVRGVALDSARLAKLDCPSVRTVFRAVALVKENANSLATQSSVVHDASVLLPAGGQKLAPTAADINKRNAEFYGK